MDKLTNPYLLLDSFEDYVGQLATLAAILFETGGDTGGDAKPVIKELNQVGYMPEPFVKWCFVLSLSFVAHLEESPAYHCCCVAV